MKRKGKLWLADWRDESGKRKRKGFASKAAAISFQHEMQRDAAAKKEQARRDRRQARSANCGPEHTTTTANGQPKHSVDQQDKSKPGKPRKPTSTKPSKR